MSAAESVGRLLGAVRDPAFRAVVVEAEDVREMLLTLDAYRARVEAVETDIAYWREQATGMAPSVDGMRALCTMLVPGGTGCVVDPQRVVAEVERLRERVIEAEAEAIRWGDALVAIGEAAGLTGAGSAEIVAAVAAVVTERDRAKSDLADNDLILEERERQLNEAVTAYHTVTRPLVDD